MPFFVLQSTTNNQTRYVASLRNGRPRVVAFDKMRDARRAKDIVQDADPIYSSTDLELIEMNRARLSTEVGGAEIAIDYCSIQEHGELKIERGVLLRKRYELDGDTALARNRLEKEYQIEVHGDGARAD